MIKAIIFDFYGVLCSDDLWDFVGADRNRGEVKNLSDKVNLGEIAWDEFCRRLSVASDRRIEEINAMYSSLKINRLLIAKINELKRSYKIGLLTNASHSHIAGILDELGAKDEFDSLIISSDIGMIKPQPGAYKLAARQLDVEPEECLFIDDAGANIDGARAVGMQALLYQNFDQFRNELEVLLAQ